MRQWGAPRVQPCRCLVQHLGLHKGAVRTRAVDIHHGARDASPRVIRILDKLLPLAAGAYAEVEAVLDREREVGHSSERGEHLERGGGDAARRRDERR